MDNFQTLEATLDLEVQNMTGINWCAVLSTCLSPLQKGVMLLLHGSV